jgi:hypothetical protein
MKQKQVFFERSEFLTVPKAEQTWTTALPPRGSLVNLAYLYSPNSIESRFILEKYCHISFDACCLVLGHELGRVYLLLPDGSFHIERSGERCYYRIVCDRSKERT